MALIFVTKHKNFLIFQEEDINSEPRWVVMRDYMPLTNSEPEELVFLKTMSLEEVKAEIDKILKQGEKK